MSKIIHEIEKCIGCGACAAVCPDFFEMNDKGKAHLKNSKKVGKNEERSLNNVGCAKDAENTCPVQAIHVK